MSKATVAKKVINSKLVAFATKTFEDLSKSKSTRKATKLINRGTRRLAKTVHGLLKKVEKKKAKQAKAVAKNKSKEANPKAMNNKVSGRVKTTGSVKKVPVN